MLKEKDLNILQDEVLYINSKGKRVKRKPRTCLGALRFFEAAYRDFTFAFFVSIPGHEVSEAALNKARTFLVEKTLTEFHKIYND
jgi:hypothetical protein